MNIELELTHNEWWILNYGGYRVKEPSYKEPLKVQINVKKAEEAESIAYEDLTFSQSLLSEYGYRERRLDYEAHESLRKKLQIKNE